jgi:flagellar hook-associated protein 1 FlgK
VAVDTSKTGQSAKVGDKVNYQGVAYYLEQMNEWVRDYAESFNKIYGVDGATDMNGNDRSGAIFYTGNNGATGRQFSFDDDFDSEKYSSVDNVGYYCLTAGNFSVSKKIEESPSTMATHTVASDGASKYDIVNELKDLSTNVDKMVFRGCDAQSFLICLMGDSALNAQTANSFYTIYTNIDDSITNTRYSISGVDADEEAANMIKYQTAYNLASKMISVLNECYQRLILETGV